MSKVSYEEQCDKALEHYLNISKEAMHYNSLIPKAIRFYKEHAQKQEFLSTLPNPPSKDPFDVKIWKIINALEHRGLDGYEMALLRAWQAKWRDLLSWLAQIPDAELAFGLTRIYNLSPDEYCIIGRRRLDELEDITEAKMDAPFVVTGLDYRGPYKKLWLKTKIDGKEHNLIAIPSKNFGELMSKATQFDNLIEEFGEDIPWLINTLEDEVDRRQDDTKMVSNLIDILVSVQSYVDRCMEKDIPIAPTLIQIGSGIRRALPKGRFPT